MVSEKIAGTIWDGMEPNERRCMAMIIDSVNCPGEYRADLDRAYTPEFQKKVMDKRNALARQAIEECKKAAKPFRRIKTKADMFNLLDMTVGSNAKINNWQFACISQGYYPPKDVDEFMCAKHLHPKIERMFDGLCN
jgi:hypothetical protein